MFLMLIICSYEIHDQIKLNWSFNTVEWDTERREDSLSLPEQKGHPRVHRIHQERVLLGGCERGGHINGVWDHIICIFEGY